MKTEKGVTLTTLVIYVTIFVIILAIMANVSAHFYKNVGEIKDSPKYVAEFNKFSMFFVADIKKNTEITSITDTTLELGDGTQYEYRGKSMYRNDKEIAKNIKSFKFTNEEHIQNNFTKQIINVNCVLGNSKENMTRNIDFVLKYW